MNKKILYVLSGWPPNVGGGVIVYVKNLREEFLKKGFDVYILYNGKYNFLVNYPYIKKSNNEKIYALINAMHFINIEDNPYSDKYMDKIFSEFIKDINPDIIHFNDIVGMPFSFVKAAKTYSNAKIINTFHNYYYICPRRDLMHIDGTHCNLCIEGYVCSECTINITSFKRMVNLLKFLLWAYSKNILPRTFYMKLLSFIQKSISLEKLNFFTSEDIINSNSNNKKIYSKRAAYAKEMLNKYTDLNISVSNDVYNIFTKFGVSKNKNIVLPIGTKASEIISHSNKKLNKNMITFGYMGGPQHIKGLYLLVSVFNSLSKYYNNINLVIYGVNKDVFEDSNNMTINNNSIYFKGNYKYSELNTILKNFDIGIVPPIWHDNAPQVVFEFLSAKIPVIGAKIGGIPDFVHNNENGLLFKAGNKTDLAQKMEMIIKNPTIINKFKKNIKPMKTMHEHVDELIKIYEE